MNLIGKAVSVSAMLAGAVFAQVAPNTITPEPAPIGISASTTGVLFSQPYCDGIQPPTGQNLVRGVYTLGTSTSPLVTLPSSQCTENYFVASSGFGGFPTNTLYIAGVSSSGAPVIFTAPVTGGTATVFAPLPVAGSNTPHTALTFDTVGTFGFGLIATGINGIQVLNSSGAVTASYPNPANGTSYLEGATVAPLTYSQCPGCLFVVAESQTGTTSAIYTLPAGAASGTVPQFFAAAPAEPEGIVFVPSAPCSFNGNSYYVSAYSHTPGNPLYSSGGAVLGFTSQQLAPYAGQFLVPDEQSGIIYAYSGPNSPTIFSSTGYQLEGSTAVTCAAPTTTSGFMTGGGQTANFAASHGMELGCSANSNHHNLEVNWAGGNQFHLTSISTVTCYLDPSRPAPAPPQASFNTLVLTGTGTYDGHAGATVSAVFTDAGELGTNDQAMIVVTYNGQTVLNVPLAKIATGNQQAHR